MTRRTRIREELRGLDHVGLVARYAKLAALTEVDGACWAYETLTPEQVALWDEREAERDERLTLAEEARERREISVALEYLREGDPLWLEELEREQGEYVAEWHQYVVKVEAGEAGGCVRCYRQTGKIDRGLAPKWRGVCEQCRGESMAGDVRKRLLRREVMEGRRQDQPKGATDATTE